MHQTTFLVKSEKKQKWGAEKVTGLPCSSPNVCPVIASFVVFCCPLSCTPYFFSPLLFVFLHSLLVFILSLLVIPSVSFRLTHIQNTWRAIHCYCSCSQMRQMSD
ncbi:hypothetical protein H112_01304 [Trichophyton rubrum D6]|uniref:Uncharacterized protein n=3 Tax=Trichophyton TaxID=5550 RepID=A0A080WJB3_TRIRC|nr:uncharacterized protein TERG_12586 [Trichophyton rubrum CBS 118892]EZF26549.1 hypothetical protein H100_01298 [Trichophyton rubrum MR850]EZF45618.1 hypothetical protein H102_01293 [Trichophyton rubrum CBS 100081]EZF56267.1 hypothetical protein H103_01302 [Trichophyton rubrum CBS 288.86]EZF66844.1 hypothetical protein H104_01282 [Trichophyton rubrum CBS 289.86]EZF77482.1 hypothetical protein H105_01309 [Trichophyton soudanense CBS 452.61]EZF88142.1 hypothetical protein H110_01302 [Trichophy